MPGKKKDLSESRKSNQRETSAGCLYFKISPEARPVTGCSFIDESAKAPLKKMSVFRSPGWAGLPEDRTKEDGSERAHDLSAQGSNRDHSGGSGRRFLERTKT
jgi:hypothetical protein